MNTPASLSPNLPELDRGVVDDGRNFCDLLWRQIEVGAESFLHSRADPFRMMQREQVMPRVQSPNKRAADPSGDEHQDESRDEFPLQRAVHCANASWIAESAIANSFVKGSAISRF